MLVFVNISFFCTGRYNYITMKSLTANNTVPQIVNRIYLNDYQFDELKAISAI